ncbi:hypothetical protein [Halovivax gelatinilyticus]|uniref:hypothetical protein n=1 Tax=Halovivax gelatinilyticus TaxID=2961597 RepID=UPI0020CA4391|nr:hypothetical protein [Halovivax gelatinilyticus]
MTRQTRRRILAVAGAASVGALAGCLGGSDDPEDDGPDADDGGDDVDPGTDDDSNDEPDDEEEASRVQGTILGDITLDNLHDEKHEVDVIVEIDGETHAWQTSELEERTGSLELDREWPTEGGSFRVRVRLDGGDFRDVRPDDWNDPDCLNLVILIDSAGALRVTGDTLDGVCAD